MRSTFIAIQRTNIRTSVLQRFACSQEWCTIYKGRKMNRSCKCVRCATMRLLLNVSHVILQRFTLHEWSSSISRALPLVYVNPELASLFQTTIDHGCCFINYGSIFGTFWSVLTDLFNLIISVFPTICWFEHHWRDIICRNAHLGHQN